MSYQFEYAYALGWDVTDEEEFTNFEEHFQYNPLRGDRVPLGIVMQKAIDKHENWQGNRPIAFTTEACFFSELADYIMSAFGSWDTQNADLTLRTRNRDGSFSYWNVKAHLPIEKQDYQHVTTTDLQDVVLRFDVISLAAA